MDYAIVVISGLDGIQGHTQTVWRLLAHTGVPVIFFVNKMDREEVDAGLILSELKTSFSDLVVDMREHFCQGQLDETLAEEIAGMDELLLEYYLEHGYSREEWKKRMIAMVRERRLFPCFFGSALMDCGIDTLLDGLCFLTETSYDINKPFSAQVYKIRHDHQKKRWVYFKIKSGVLKTRDEIAFFNRDTGAKECAKINEIRYYNGAKGTAVSEAYAGELCAVSGLGGVRCGDLVGSELGSAEYEIMPMLRVSVEYDTSRYSAKMILEYFKILEMEDPMLSVSWDEALQEIHLNIMGIIQLEILKEVIRDRFLIDVEFGPCRILYRETICSPVVGYGHFEPLKHYAEVHLKLEPAARGSGILFESACSFDCLNRNFQNLIRTHIFEKEHKGVLLGMPITDIKITLLTGRSHEKHTEGGDFREATYRALRQGLLRAESVILEPYYSFVIEADQSLVGKILADIQKRSGTFEPPETVGENVRILGRAPVATMLDYYQKLVSDTRGKGSMSVFFDGYEPCHNPQEVRKEFSYDPQRDVENTGDSVFCSHGSGFIVTWQEAEQYMHCNSE